MLPSLCSIQVAPQDDRLGTYSGFWLLTSNFFPLQPGDTAAASNCVKLAPKAGIVNSRTTGGRPIRRKGSECLRKTCAFLMALVFVWDIGFHLLAPLHAISNGSESISSFAGESNTDPDPDCGIPGHGCALSHHHHFPALVSTAQFVISAVACRRPVGASTISAIYVPREHRQIRAPPAEA